jgi:hypothetical protein
MSATSIKEKLREWAGELNLEEYKKSAFGNSLDAAASKQWPDYEFDTRFNILAGAYGAEVTTWKRKDGKDVKKAASLRIREFVAGFADGYAVAHSARRERKS